MQPVERLGTATAPDGTVFVLTRHAGVSRIRSGTAGAELTSTRRPWHTRAVARTADRQASP